MIVNGQEFDIRPRRHLDPLTPSQRKNLELFERVPKTLNLQSGPSPFHGSGCGSCTDFAFCRTHKNAQPTTEYCMMPSRGFRFSTTTQRETS